MIDKKKGYIHNMFKELFNINLFWSLFLSGTFSIGTKMPPWLWTLLRRQSSIYCIVLCRLLAPAPALLGPARSVPCRSSECRGFGGCDRLHCRKTSECEGRGGRNCYRRLFLVTHTGKSWRRGGAAPAPRDFLSTRPQWLKASEWEWEVCGCEAEEKRFHLSSVFVATPPGKQLEKMAMPSPRRWMTFVPVVNTTTTTRVVQNVQVVFIDFTNPCLARQSTLPNLETQVI